MIDVRIATILPVHNHLDATRIFLRSFYGTLDVSTLKDRCILILVDDGSTDGSAEWINENYPDTKLLRGTGNLWWSGSVNVGVTYARDHNFSHFLLFNNDNIVEQGFFVNLAAVLERDGANRIISSRVINMFPSEHVIYGGVTFNRRRAEYVVNKNFDQPATVNTAGGMGVLVPLEVVSQIGVFDEVNFPQKSGDTDFFLRAEIAGFAVYYTPSLIVYNDNRISGFSDNYSIRNILNAYSFPKGYMNLKVDLKLFTKHGKLFWAVYNLAKRNLIFLFVGSVRILKGLVRT